MTRSAAIIVQDGHVALIERRNSARGDLYYLFPGGGIEAGESASEAAVRESEEELGLLIEIRQLIAEVQYNNNLQLYFLADVLGGTFGTGQGEEMIGLSSLEGGMYIPVWMAIANLLHQPVYPKSIAEIIVQANSHGWPQEAVKFVDNG